MRSLYPALTRETNEPVLPDLASPTRRSLVKELDWWLPRDGICGPFKSYSDFVAFDPWWLLVEEVDRFRRAFELNVKPDGFLVVGGLAFGILSPVGFVEVFLDLFDLGFHCYFHYNLKVGFNNNRTFTGDTKVTGDLLYDPKGAPQLLAEGTLYKGIVGDQVAFGTNLSDALSAKNSPIGGKVDVNINLSGNISGDNGQLSKLFNSPEIQKQIMDTVLYKLNDYKRQQGVIS